MNHELSKGLARTVLLAVVFSVVAVCAQAPAPSGRLVDIGGYRVHLNCTGAGTPTVVVAAGWFSFDWGLVQPRVATFTRICSYDPSGTAWSDPFPAAGVPSCSQRVEELHKLLQSAPVEGPYVLAGFSIGGLYARLFAHQYPGQVAGMVIVDHAFVDTGESLPAPVEPPSNPPLNSPPVLLSKTPIVLGLEDDENFKKLPEVDQERHRWAMSLHPLRPSPEAAAACFTAVEKVTANDPHPLGDRPLIVISTNYDSPQYRALQAKLLSLSRDSRQVIAENSSHMVIVDQPDAVVSAIRQVVEAVRSRGQLR